MLFEKELREAVCAGILHLYEACVASDEVAIQPTRKDFEGDLTVVVFNLSKKAGRAPDALAGELGEWLKLNVPSISCFNVVKGFLNIVFEGSSWLKAFAEVVDDPSAYRAESPSVAPGHPILVEYSSPNTNKPLHLGHIRNNLLGFSVAELLKATGSNVRKVNLVNDRGIHICKSMLAWMKRSNGETPESSGMKGDHLVGKYYVEFDKMYREDISRLVAEGMSEEDAKKSAPAILEAQELLRKWEAGDQKTVDLWRKMNGWVYDGFTYTYKMLGVDFDDYYYESDMYLLGKDMVKEGLERGVFFKKDDGSVWVDLTDEGLDQKLLLRGDGTSVYITQDMGTARKRYEDTAFRRLIYVVGNEQDYHFKVLRLILKKMGYEWWDSLFHLSYNMVDLPSGRMKSREGTVVDADDLMQEMIETAGKITRELGKIDDFDSEEALELYRTIGLGALKYFILKVDPEKRMLFNPEESIDFNGNTGPFIQYTYARIRSVIRKAGQFPELKEYLSWDASAYSLMLEKEKVLLKTILRFPSELEEAAARFSPAIMANYSFELAKVFNQFYHDHAIVDPAEPDTTRFRLQLAYGTAEVIKRSLALLGIHVPERM